MRTLFIFICGEYPSEYPVFCLETCGNFIVPVAFSIYTRTVGKQDLDRTWTINSQTNQIASLCLDVRYGRLALLSFSSCSPDVESALDEFKSTDSFYGFRCNPHLASETKSQDYVHLNLDRPAPTNLVERRTGIAPLSQRGELRQVTKSTDGGCHSARFRPSIETTFINRSERMFQVCEPQG